MIPKYPVRAAKGLARLKRHFNDIEVFVEDTKNANMWLELVKRIIPSHVRLKSVNQLGGRDRVLAACRADQVHDGRRKIYIIDGDFDYILGRKKPRLKFLYRIRAYCVENLLISEQGVEYVGVPSRPDWSLSKMNTEFGYKRWLSEVSKVLLPLFRAYAVAHELSPNLKTTGYPLGNLLVNTAKGPELCKVKVYKRIHSLLKEVRSVASAMEVRQSWIKICGSMAKLSVKEVISGKDYIFPLLAMRISKVLKFQGSHEQLKVYMARGFDRRMEPRLCQRLKAICP